ncbi:cytochrome C oxidase subunit IV [Paenibacillus sp. BIHB 4019]|uniref:Cytochrome C oxidase subunit IV n=1 Tax=Paenibacillus sp. BIHB 4019 TaxID=1870819 RepID=A0A1B2DCS3_9BACL|nr:cytochrome C oxidase subunit IV family protein [Paenibacillus sp. BIHB 4019]ANY65508.1 cytochrome C oxidase subunit IV [Paenibacillus sp. BIHB 4019]
MASNHSTAEEQQRPVRHNSEGPKKHIIAFIFSILLTLVAFAAVAAGEINKSFIYIIIMGCALLQVFVQMAFWMHMKDRGHVFATVGILMGVFIAFTAFIMAEYWVWW